MVISSATLYQYMPYVIITRRKLYLSTLQSLMLPFSATLLYLTNGPVINDLHLPDTLDTRLGKQASADVQPCRGSVLKLYLFVY